MGAAGKVEAALRPYLVDDRPIGDSSPGRQQARNKTGSVDRETLIPDEG